MINVGHVYTRVETRLEDIQVIWVIWVCTFCQGQVDLIQFIKYPGLIQILH